MSGEAPIRVDPFGQPGKMTPVGAEPMVRLIRKIVAAVL